MSSTKRYVLLEDGYFQNVQLIKCTGMIPFTLYKNHRYDASIATFKRGEYGYIENEVKGLNLTFINEKTPFLWLNAWLYIIENAKNIDYLQVYIFTFYHCVRNIAYIYTYKFLNRNGKAYLKSDIDGSIRIKRKRKMNALKNCVELISRSILFHKCDLITIETKMNYDFILQNKRWKHWKDKIRYLPNGVVVQEIVKDKERANTILTVGRLGTYEKNTEMLLEAFKRIADVRPNWTLRLVGSIQDDFKDDIEKYYRNNPHLKERVVFVGEVSNRNVLREIYCECKIFCMPSRFESFGLALAETCSFGLFPVASNFDASFDLTDNGRLGRIFNKDSIDELVTALLEVTEDGFYNELWESEVSIFIRDNFNWNHIIDKLDKYLMEL